MSYNLLSKYIISALFIIIGGVLFSQNDKIKIKKEDYSIFFFQIGNKSDTISPESSDLFVLKIGISRKCKTAIEVTNGRLTTTNNDSIFKLVKMPSMNYLHTYYDSLVTTEPKHSNQQTPCPFFKTQVNGSGINSNTQNITIKIRSTSSDSIYLINKFYYR